MIPAMLEMGMPDYSTLSIVEIMMIIASELLCCLFV